MKKAVLLLWLILLGFTLPATAASASQLLSAGRVDDAISQLKATLAASPNDAEAYILLARANYYLERWNEAAHAAEQAVRLAPDNSDYHMWLGRIYGEKADHSSFVTAATLASKVREQFEKAVALDPSNARARADLAEFYMSAPALMGGGKDKALNQAAQLKAQHVPAGYWVEASIAEREKRIADAEKAYRAALDASHGNAVQWLDLAAFYFRQRRLGEMEQAVSSGAGAAMQSGDLSVLVEAAELLFRAGRNFNGAIQYLRQYLQSDRKVEDAPAYRAHLLLGNLLAARGDKAGAADEYRAALALASGFQPARDALARLSR